VAAELDAVNAERRDVETRIRFGAEALVPPGPPAPAYVLASEGWHPGVIGIVASRLAERHHRPVVLIALDGEEGTGSGRSIPAFDLLAGLEAGAGELLRHGGHRAAAGLTIARDRVDAFREAFVAHAAAVLAPEDLVPTQRLDAVVSGDALALGLAEELERLGPFGAGNPEPALLVPAALLDDPRPMGEGRHVAFTLSAGGARSRCVAFGAGSRLPAAAGEPVEAAVRLEVNRWGGAIEPRLVLRHARPARPAPIDIVGEPPSFAEGIRTELHRRLDEPSAVLPSRHGREFDPRAPEPGAPGVAELQRESPSRRGREFGPRAPEPEPADVAELRRESPSCRGREFGPQPPEPEHPGAAELQRKSPSGRLPRDKRNSGLAGLLADLVSTGDPVLAVAAHAPQRARALGDRVGGFAVCSWAALEDDPGLAEPFAHVVALDPPAHAHRRRLLDDLSGRGWTHVAWGEPELGFARRIHEWDYALRAPLADAYRALRAVGAAEGEVLATALRGDGPQPRSPALAGRLVRVLSELGLVVLEREGSALRVVEAPERTALERSAAFRAYRQRLEDGLRYLTTSTARAAA
jgi:single-stranded-DNA-specific exonuclease